MPKPGYKLRRVSGNAVGRNSKRIVGCENCNFCHFHSSEHTRTNPETDTSKKSEKFKTGGICPTCNAPLLRVFDSQAEFGRFRELRILQEKGEISGLTCQVKYPLHAPNHSDPEKPIYLYSYVADFCYTEHDHNEPTSSEYIVEDVKPKGGLVTDVFAMKHKHFEAQYGLKLRIVER